MDMLVTEATPCPSRCWMRLCLSPFPHRNVGGGFDEGGFTSLTGSAWILSGPERHLCNTMLATEQADDWIR
jgi:hypothetical protein